MMAGQEDIKNELKVLKRKADTDAGKFYTGGKYWQVVATPQSKHIIFFVGFNNNILTNFRIPF